MIDLHKSSSPEDEKCGFNGWYEYEFFVFIECFIVLHTETVRLVLPNNHSGCPDRVCTFTVERTKVRVLGYREVLNRLF